MMREKNHQYGSAKWLWIVYRGYSIIKQNHFFSPSTIAITSMLVRVLANLSQKRDFLFIATDWRSRLGSFSNTAAYLYVRV